ncbi:MAG: hypothetical protein A2W86_09730 [Bacteroidetes bacterium GWD2_45_23]|nr:MAG: hypothetical protein A2W87_05795 [Bacteroidetes bacterium GWC2_46_850]OFX73313.1 MAG: hypothetical protein A2071_12375 [Bacteroidetes bacterium GWC1_47_7]OFX83712.1 MAG: hypothetical protein A2W86_09730 [Bacteroidetes bacterium GWD2_45_23]HAR39133.1 hypothetical protein [Porphyromonadaceae bacterium]HBA99505.1 hypothetical protein [Porphyromonadaceae bacterium]
MKKEEFKQKTRELLNELADYITRLENKAGEIADDAKEGYRERVDNLKGLKDNLSSKLEDYENIADGKWEVVRESAADFFASVSESWKENFDKVADAFKKNDRNDPEATAGNQPDGDVPQ